MELIRKRLKKGNDMSPLNAEALGRNRIGPDKKNLLIPKDEVKMLRIKVISGSAELKFL